MPTQLNQKPTWPTLPCLHSWTFRGATELARGLGGGAEVTAVLNSTVEGLLVALVAWRTTVAAAPASSLGCSQSPSSSTSHSDRAKAVRCRMEKCTRSSEVGVEAARDGHVFRFVQMSFGPALRSSGGSLPYFPDTPAYLSLAPDSFPPRTASA